MRFFSPPENPSLTERRQHALVDVEILGLLADQLHELDRVELRLAVVLALGVERGLQEVGVVHAGDLDGVLEGHEDAFARPLVGIHLEEVLALEQHRAAGHFVFRMAGQRPRQGALAGAVGPHDGVHLAGVHREIDAAEDLFAFGLYLQIGYLKHSDCLFLDCSRGPTPASPWGPTPMAASARFARAAV